MSRGTDIIRTTMSGPSSVQASSSSLSSDNEILYGTQTDRLQESHKRRNKTWNCPRKTIKAIDSMGRIEKRHDIMDGLRTMRKSTASNKCKNKVKRRVERYKHLLELAKPKSVACNEINDSITCFKKEKFCTTHRNSVPKVRIDCEKKLLEPTQNLTRYKTVMTKKQVPMIYRTTEHTMKLAEPRVRHEIGLRLPGKVVESALFATGFSLYLNTKTTSYTIYHEFWQQTYQTPVYRQFAQPSKRLVELAIPKSNTRSTVQPENDSVAIKTTSGVSRDALKASCSPRILKLSAPKNPKTLINLKKTTKSNHNPAPDTQLII